MNIASALPKNKTALIIGAGVIFGGLILFLKGKGTTASPADSTQAANDAGIVANDAATNLNDLQNKTADNFNTFAGNVSAAMAAENQRLTDQNSLLTEKINDSNSMLTAKIQDLTNLVNSKSVTTVVDSINSGSTPAAASSASHSTPSSVLSLRSNTYTVAGQNITEFVPVSDAKTAANQTPASNNYYADGSPKWMFNAAGTKK